MTSQQPSYSSLIFWVGALSLWQFVSNFSPNPTIQWLSIGLCLLDITLFLWLIHPKANRKRLQQAPFRYVLYGLLGVQFCLSLPIQVSDWQVIESQTLQLSAEEITTCLKPTRYRPYYQFSCVLSGDKVSFDLPRSMTTFEIRESDFFIEHHQRYTYSVLEVLFGLNQKQTPTAFQQSRFVVGLPIELADQFSLEY